MPGMDIRICSDASVKGVSGITENVDVLLHIHFLESVTGRTEVLSRIEFSRLLVDDPSDRS